MCWASQHPEVLCIVQNYPPDWLEKYKITKQVELFVNKLTVFLCLRKIFTRLNYFQNKLSHLENKFSNQNLFKAISFFS